MYLIHPLCQYNGFIINKASIILIYFLIELPIVLPIELPIVLSICVRLASESQGGFGFGRCRKAGAEALAWAGAGPA